jgi:hypothetical protein
VVLPSVIDSDAELQKIKVSLLDFSVYNSWYLINEGYNTITFKNELTQAQTAVAIPEGNYSYYRLAKKIRELFPPCECTWLADQNKMMFSFLTSHTMYFDGIYDLLGFPQGAMPSGTSILSERAMSPLATTHIVVNLVNTTPVHGALTLDNMGGEVKPSNILARVPINAEPFRLITYANQTPDVGIFTSDNTIQRLEFLITNEDGMPLTFLPDFEMFLRLEVWNLQNDDLHEMKVDLQEIKQTLKDLFLMKHLNSITKNPPTLNNIPNNYSIR